MKAVILAGGKGSRLKPYTTHFPKPLMPVGDRPILEIVINQLKDNGITDIVITTGHLEGLIRSFFKDGKNFGVNITYSFESSPLGTAGPLDLVRDELDETFILMNGDILSDVNFKNLIKLHHKTEAMATITLSKRVEKIDYGVISIDERDRLVKWDEKPDINFLVSTGIYVFEPGALKYVQAGKYLNLPDLIISMIDHGENVLTHQHKGFWLDIGRPDDYEKACALYEKNL